jgi:4-amino-4-deoxy-L-arabinose transferase-like glycosyltransferase
VIRALASRGAPVVVSLLTTAFLWWAWGSLREPSFIHDEAAYRLQAEIFGSFRLSAPPPPLPEFFEQYHVLLVPRLAPKYPPGHALLLVPGVWLGWPGLTPVLLHGLAAGLLFCLARRLAGGWVALLAWLVWLSAPSLNVWRATYLSQATTTAAWMLAAWLLLSWWESGRPRDLVGLALCVAWVAITRPLTAVALAAPAGLVVLAGSWRRRAGLPLLAAAGAGLAVLSILPVWNAAVTGDWRTLPYTRYAAAYIPWDRLGFGESPARPERELPPDMALFAEGYQAEHRAHTVGSLPGALGLRLLGAGREMWGGARWRVALALSLGIGLLCLDRRGWFALAWALAPFLAYLLYAHPPHWAVYYHEIQPVLAFVTALGLWRALGVVVSRSVRNDPAPGALALPAAGLAALLVGLGIHDTAELRPRIQQRYDYTRAFARTLEAVKEPRAVVFVRYHPRHNPHRSLVENPPDFGRARIWVARDRGADNLRLIALAPDRVPYLFDEASGTLFRLEKQR